MWWSRSRLMSAAKSSTSKFSKAWEQDWTARFWRRSRDGVSVPRHTMVSPSLPSRMPSFISKLAASPNPGWHRRTDIIEVVKADGVRQVASADFPTRWGKFRIYGFRSEGGANRGEEAVALVMGDVEDTVPLVRVHSQCLTGDVFHSLRCDCRQQLELSLAMIRDEGA